MFARITTCAHSLATLAMACYNTSLMARLSPLRSARERGARDRFRTGAARVWEAPSPCSPRPQHRLRRRGAGTNARVWRRRPESHRLALRPLCT